MIRSMTGFGEAEEVTAAGVVRVEIKTVNHRFFNANIRTPTGFDRLEGDIQSWLRPFLSRGHVTYTLSIGRDTTEANDTLPELDLERAKRYGELLETLRHELGVEAPVDLSHISRFGEIFRAPEPGNASAQVEGEVIRRLTEAAAAADRPAPRIIATLPICVTDDEERVRTVISRTLTMYGELPSYKAMFEREGVAEPGDLALVGSASRVSELVAELAEAGVTDYAASEFTTNEQERDQTRDLLKTLIG